MKTSPWRVVGHIQIRAVERCKRDQCSGQIHVAESINPKAVERNPDFAVDSYKPGRRAAHAGRGDVVRVGIADMGGQIGFRNNARSGDRDAEDRPFERAKPLGR